jgi:hypothetical protein
MYSSNTSNNPSNTSNARSRSFCASKLVISSYFNKGNPKLFLLVVCNGYIEYA